MNNSKLKDRLSSNFLNKLQQPETPNESIVNMPTPAVVANAVPTTPAVVANAVPIPASVPTPASVPATIAVVPNAVPPALVPNVYYLTIEQPI